jgi:RNA-binding protein
MNRTLSDLKYAASQLSPALNIGKSGISDSLIDELQGQLKRNKLVKVKILRTALIDMDRSSIAETLAGRTGARLVEVKGNSVVLYVQ